MKKTDTKNEHRQRINEVQYHIYKYLSMKLVIVGLNLPRPLVMSLKKHTSAHQMNGEKKNIKTIHQKSMN
tara:strand:- start:4412 stop:4621 length:210 start_codon:yes stop_codon:yes gene_type:complete